MKIKSASLDIYSFVFLYFYDCSLDDFRSYMEEHFGETVDKEYCRALCIGLDDAKVVAMWFSDYKNLPEIVHESVHAANFVFNYICHEQKTEDDEPMAYLTEWIFKQAISKEA